MDARCFAAYAHIVQREFGIQLPKEKKALLESRLFKLFQDEEMNPSAPFRDAEGFLRYLKEDKTGKALKILSEAITTHHTYFMREADHFRYFRDTVLPWVEQEAHLSRDVRTWCAACSTGEEAYTLAMLLTDHFALRGPGWETSLLATDLAEDVIEQSKVGIYTDEAVNSLPEHWRRVYFHPHGTGFVQAVESLRKSIVFHTFNLLTHVFPFKKPFHVIFCRNVMIYFDRQTRQELVRKFYDALVPGGYLFVGHAETVDREMAPFDYACPSVYRKPLAHKSSQGKRPLHPESDEEVKPLRRAVASPLPEKKTGISLSSGAGKNMALTRTRNTKVRLIVMGASTGGTEALAEVLHHLIRPMPPILIVQHIPPMFSELFAERLERECQLEASEARDGEYLEENHIYIAPGDKHIRVRRMGQMMCLEVRKGQLVNGHCPSVDVLFQSVADQRLAPKTLGVILTGMGSDGARGLLAMRQAGSHTLGQDEASSVVYGMPRAAWVNGAVERQLPLQAIAAAMSAYCQK